MIIANQNGAVELYYDNVKKAETYTAGLQITGTLSVGTGNIVGHDNAKHKLGTSDDKSDIHERPRKAICSCVTTETASGVSIKFVSLFVAVTMISSTSAVSPS